MRSQGDPHSLGKPYAEAFPHLDIHDLERARVESESAFYQWEDEDGLIIGHIAVEDYTSERLEFHYRFLGTRNVAPSSGFLIVNVTWKKTGAHWLKPSLQCPGCGRHVAKIYYLGELWRCKTCHGLLNLAQRLSPINKALWQRNEARERLKTVPKTAAERRKREKDKQVFGAAVRYLADNSHRSELPEAFRCRAIGRWLSENELPLVSVSPGALGYGWAPGDFGQFSGLYKREAQLAPSPASASLDALVEPQSAASDHARGQSTSTVRTTKIDPEAPSAEDHARKSVEKAGRTTTNGDPRIPRVSPWFG